MKENEINLKQEPAVKGLRFRKFAGETDYPLMADIINASAKADREDRYVTVSDITNDYAHLTHSDPDQDMIFAEIDGETIAYSRVEWWQEEDPNDRIYSLILNISPEWRMQGIERAMIGWCEERNKISAQDHPQDSQRFYQTYSSDLKPQLNQLLESQGYQAARYFISMSRPLVNIPTAELPSGIEARHVKESDIRKIWDASIEAFKDHWGFSQPTESDFQAYQGSKFFQPDLWQVAWEGDRVVSSVLNYIDHDYNREFNKKRGWTEEITTQRAWRHRGIARALIVRSMHMHKAKGMTEVALGVDTNNPNGALQLYQSLGYEKEKTWITYRKKM